MYTEPIFLKPVFKERIWGGSKLNEMFGYDIPHYKTGEAWVISAHQNGPSLIENGPLRGMTLRQAWKAHPELFGKGTSDNIGDFPLLVKILDANDNLSVQVHPDDLYARNIEGESYGKTECWYVLDCEPGAEIIFGHYAKSADEFIDMVKKGQWDVLLKKVKVNKGDFFYVPSGKIHAIGKGIVILETQQSSDITYRVFDYDRVVASGNSRELHLDKALDVVTFPDDEAILHQQEKQMADMSSTQLIKEKYFTVYSWQLSGNVNTPLKKGYLLISVINGDGEIVVGEKSYSIRKGNHFIVPATIDGYTLYGDMDLIVSHE
ncbi:MAG TPA: mannose-6-phosphate isomerase, class I [Virgibacillus sp.]|nr:mannose-6-phosphate isomerase, class I [Virgibacillus sp.]HLR69365.1 mannose-6-phosphate isomerase, class I [Virgibacillus sp.]